MRYMMFMRTASPSSNKNINFELLQKRIAQLEEENKALREEASQLAKETCEVEEHEKKLMTNITMQLHTTTRQFEEMRKYKLYFYDYCIFILRNKYI